MATTADDPWDVPGAAPGPAVVEDVQQVLRLFNEPVGCFVLECSRPGMGRALPPLPWGTLVGDENCVWGTLIIGHDASDPEEGLGLVVHEAAHLAVMRMTGAVQDYRDALVKWVALAGTGRVWERLCEVPPQPAGPDGHHDAMWVRAVCHLLHRAQIAGLSPSWQAALGYGRIPRHWLPVRALRGEAWTHRRKTLGEILAAPLPRRFRKVVRQLGIPEGRGSA